MDIEEAHSSWNPTAPTWANISYAALKLKNKQNV